MENNTGLLDSLSCLQLDGYLYKCLRAYNFDLVQDLDQCEVNQLSQETKLSKDDCKRVLDSVYQYLNSISFQESLGKQSAFGMFDYKNQGQSISTLVRVLDEQSGHDGFPIGSIVEVFGESGCGKTQLCMQMCVSSHLPVRYGGCGGEILYIDTENTFRTDRLLKIADRVFKTIKLRYSQVPKDFCEKSLLDSIYICSCNESYKLNSLIFYHLESFLIKHPKVKLVIIDSIAFQYRYGFDSGVKERTRITQKIAEILKNVSRKRHVLVLLVNQIAFSLIENDVIPALGSLWAHTASIKLQLFKLRNGYRAAIYQKCNMKKRETCFYALTESGLTDLPDASLAHTLQQENKETRKEMQDFITHTQQKFRQENLVSQTPLLDSSFIADQAINHLLNPEIGNHLEIVQQVYVKMPEKEKKFEFASENDQLFNSSPDQNFLSSPFKISEQINQTSSQFKCSPPQFGEDSSIEIIFDETSPTKSNMFLKTE